MDDPNIDIIPALIAAALFGALLAIVPGLALPILLVLVGAMLQARKR